MTLIMPVLGLLAIGVVQLVSAIIEPPEVETTTIGYVDEIGGFNQYTTQGPIELVRYDTQDDAVYHGKTAGNAAWHFSCYQEIPHE